MHQYCRGSNLKCITSKNIYSDSNIETSSYKQQEYVGDIILKEDDFEPALEILCMHEIEENILIMGMT